MLRCFKAALHEEKLNKKRKTQKKVENNTVDGIMERVRPL